jgi:hypothetical protein
MRISQQTLETNKPLSTTEIIAGLKDALVVGTDKSVDILGVTNGYYGDDLVKILLPPEANVIIENINKIPGGSGMIDDLLLKINRAAENAAKEAKPIFVNSINSMTINDAVGILNGADNAATEYLRRTTNDKLFQLYKPKIKTSLDKKLIGNISTTRTWDELTDKWNQVANSLVGQIAGFEPVEIDLDAYLTQKALDGLYIKIEAQEKLIREDPVARVNNLLKRVFGSVDS